MTFNVAIFTPLTRWVYTHEKDSLKGAVLKARCVILGYRHLEEIHFNKYGGLSPVVELLSIGVLTAIATGHDIPIHHLDISRSPPEYCH